MRSSDQRFIIERLQPGMDLKKSLARLVQDEAVTAGFVVSAVGSLSVACLRLAGADQHVEWPGPYEIVSLIGTLGPDGLHLHISLADAAGRVCGGHLVDGCLVHTTVELVVGLAPGLVFRRIADTATGYGELSVEASSL